MTTSKSGGMPTSSRQLRELYEPLRRFAAVIGRWDVEPDDLVQEAYAKVLAKQPGADPRPRAVPAAHDREPRDRRAPAVGRAASAAPKIATDGAVDRRVPE